MAKIWTICLLLILLHEGGFCSERERGKNEDNVLELRQVFQQKILRNKELAGKYLQDKDPEIRRYALMIFFECKKMGALSEIEKALDDPEKQIRRDVVLALVSLPKENRRVRNLIDKVVKEEKENEVRQIAVRHSWPFHRKINLLRDDLTWDHDIVTVHSLTLPLKGWLFKTDPSFTGHLKNYFKQEYSASDWRTMNIGYWEEQGLPNYDGVAWYRIVFDMPPKMKHNAVEISFGAVDESAWIWLNGIYLGGHDLGEEGWNVPFDVDCRKEIKWGKKNVLVVRVLDTNKGGGIWKPVKINVLK